MRYLRLKSLTWWSGAFLVVMGVLKAAGVPEMLGGRLDGLQGVLAALTQAMMSVAGAGGETAPALLIGAGLGLIGHREALHKNAIAADDNAEALHIELMAAQRAIAQPYATLSIDEDGNADDDLPPGVRDPYGPGGTRE